MSAPPHPLNEPLKFSTLVIYSGVDFVSAGSKQGSTVVPDYDPVQPVNPVCVLYGITSLMGVWSGT